MNDITALIATMKAAAEKATPGEWRAFSHPASGTYAVHTPKDKRCEDVIKWPGFDGQKNAAGNAEYIATANPANVKALVEALEKAQQAANINNWWKPDVCPITGRRFFMWVEHPQMGMVPTYGGPFDSYTIPTRDSDGEFSCERYDHDVGDWVDGECVGAYLIDDDEQCRVYELEQNASELREQLRTVELSNSVLESRTFTVKLPAACADDEYFNDGVFQPMRYERDVERALRAAGIQVIEGEGQ